MKVQKIYRAKEFYQYYDQLIQIQYSYREVESSEGKGIQFYRPTLSLVLKHNKVGGVIRPVECAECKDENVFVDMYNRHSTQKLTREVFSKILQSVKRGVARRHFEKR